LIFFFLSYLLEYHALLAHLTVRPWLFADNTIRNFTFDAGIVLIIIIIVGWALNRWFTIIITWNICEVGLALWAIFWTGASNAIRNAWHTFFQHFIQIIKFRWALTRTLMLFNKLFIDWIYISYIYSDLVNYYEWLVNINIPNSLYSNPLEHWSQDDLLVHFVQ